MAPFLTAVRFSILAAHNLFFRLWPFTKVHCNRYYIVRITFKYLFFRNLPQPVMSAKQFLRPIISAISFMKVPLPPSTTRIQGEKLEIYGFVFKIFSLCGNFSKCFFIEAITASASASLSISAPSRRWKYTHPQCRLHR